MGKEEGRRRRKRRRADGDGGSRGQVEVVILGEGPVEVEEDMKSMWVKKTH